MYLTITSLFVFVFSLIVPVSKYKHLGLYFIKCFVATTSLAITLFTFDWYSLFEHIDSAMTSFDGFLIGDSQSGNNLFSNAYLFLCLLNSIGLFICLYLMYKDENKKL